MPTLTRPVPTPEPPTAPSDATAGLVHLLTEDLNRAAGPERLVAAAERADRAITVHLILQPDDRTTWPRLLQALPAAQATTALYGEPGRPYHCHSNEQHVVIWPLGRQMGPHPLLLTASPTPVTGSQIQRWAQVASWASMLVEHQHTTRRAHAADIALHTARTALVAHLLAHGSRTADASPAVAPLAPALADSAQVRVSVLTTAPGEDQHLLRDEADAAWRDRRTDALVIACPMGARQIVGLHPALCDLDEQVEQVAAWRPGRSAGLSPTGSWSDLPRLWEMARSSAATARCTGQRLAVHHGHPLPEHLGPSARAWAHAVLAPLGDDALSLVTLCADHMILGAVGAAARHHLHRHSVTVRIRAAHRRLGLDFDCPGHRIALALAARLAHLPRPPAHTPPADSPHALLSHPVAVAHAAARLAPLPPDLRRTLIMWVRHDGRHDHTAEALGISRNTTAARLRRAAEILRLPLLSRPPQGRPHGGWHDVVCLLHSTGEVPISHLPGMPEPS